jgi:hypothetical protein
MEKGQTDVSTGSLEYTREKKTPEGAPWTKWATWAHPSRTHHGRGPSRRSPLLGRFGAGGRGVESTSDSTSPLSRFGGSSGRTRNSPYSVWARGCRPAWPSCLYKGGQGCPNIIPQNFKMFFDNAKIELTKC